MGDKTDYPLIRAWGLMIGSNNNYINDQIEIARSMKAPKNAIYRRHHPLTPDDPTRHGPSDEWAVYDEEAVQRWPFHTRHQIEERLAAWGLEHLIIARKPAKKTRK